jgi:hypothetical protein
MEFCSRIFPSRCCTCQLHVDFSKTAFCSSNLLAAQLPSILMGFSHLDFSNDAYIQRILSKFFDTFFLKSIDRSASPINEKLRMKCFLNVFSRLDIEGNIHHFKHFLLVRYLGNFLTRLADSLEPPIDSTFLFKLLDEIASSYCDIESGSRHMNHIFCDLLSLSVPLVLGLHASLVSDRYSCNSVAFCHLQTLCSLQNRSQHFQSLLLSIQFFTKFLDAIQSLTFRCHFDLSVGKYAYSFRLCLAMLLRITIEIVWYLFHNSAPNFLTKEQLVYLLSFYTDQLPTLNRYRTVLSRVLPTTSICSCSMTEESNFRVNFQLSSQQRADLLKFICDLWMGIYYLDNGTLRSTFLRRFINDLYRLGRICQSTRLSQSNSLSFLLIIQEHFFLPLGSIAWSFRDHPVKVQSISPQTRHSHNPTILVSNLLL